MEKQNTANKKFFLFMLAAAAVIVTAIFVSPKDQPENNVTVLPTPPENSQINTKLIIIHGTTKASYDSQLEQNASVFDLLKKVSQKEGVELTTKQYDFGIMVESLNGKKSDEYNYWVYEVNDKPAAVGADSYILKDGDSVTWKYVQE